MTAAVNTGERAETRPAGDAIEKKASGSSFYLAMRVMPKAEREAMFAIYAFCRAVDDIADDGVGSPADRRAALNKWRSDIDALFQGTVSPRVRFLDDTVKHFGLKKDDFHAVIDGMEMDVDESMQDANLAMLDLYCDRVASAVGRLSVKVFGMEEDPGTQLAHHLGRALQLTNILRDLDEDAGLGRLYLPSEFLDQAGIETRDPGRVISDPAIDVACRALAKVAWRHYEESDRVFRARPKGKLRAPRLMSEVYSRILAKMESMGWAPPRERVRIGKAALLFIMLRYGLAG